MSDDEMNIDDSTLYPRLLHFKTNVADECLTGDGRWCRQKERQRLPKHRRVHCSLDRQYPINDFVPGGNEGTVTTEPTYDRVEMTHVKGSDTRAAL